MKDLSIKIENNMNLNNIESQSCTNLNKFENHKQIKINLSNTNISTKIMPNK
jgi:hypothetical protein